MNVDEIRRQVRASELEAGFSLICTLAVCVFQEWGRWHHVGAAIAIPIAMAFSVHGVNNAAGLGQWNYVYVPTRVIVIVLGVAYSYQHYYHFLPTLEVAGFDLKPAVAFIMELLTLSALIAHQGHSSRLTAADHESGDEVIVETELDDESVRLPPLSSAGSVPDPVALFVPPMGASSPPLESVGLHQPLHQLNGVHNNA